MVESLLNSMSLPKEYCNLQTANELVLLIISKANPGFKSHVNLKLRQFKMKSKKDSNLSTSTPRNNITYYYIMSVKNYLQNYN